MKSSSIISPRACLITRRRRREENQSPKKGRHEANERRKTTIRSAGFQTCCIADFPIGRPRQNPALRNVQRPAGLETRDTADSEVCATFQPAVRWHYLTLFGNRVRLPTNGKASRTAPSPQPSPSEREREKTLGVRPASGRLGLGLRLSLRRLLRGLWEGKSSNA